MAGKRKVWARAVFRIRNAIAENLNSELAGYFAVGCELCDEHFEVTSCKSIGIEIRVCDVPGGSGYAVDVYIVSVGKAR